jgi:hypothetical protein
LNLFAGFDAREEVGFHTFVSSVIHNTSDPVSITPVRGDQRDGSNAFTYERFLIPYRMGFKGWAIFMDGSDMVLKADLAELLAHRDHYKAVQVVKHQYKTKHPRKYVGTSMEARNDDYPCKNWSSVMLINCAHFGWRGMTPEKVAQMKGPELHRFSFLAPDAVGELPPAWNWLADEYGPNEDAKVLHWTAGIPAFLEYTEAPMARDWWNARDRVNHVAL